MDHSEATAEQLVERYMLDELTDEKAERFEEHYFECADCATEMRTAVTLMRYGRDAALAEPEPATATNVVPISASTRFRHWIGTAAAAVIGFIVAVPVFRAPAPMPVMSIGHEVELTLGEQRAAGDIPAIEALPGAPVIVLVDLPGGAPAYEFTARRTDGEQQFEPRRFTPEPDATAVPLTFTDLQAGTYEVVTVAIAGDGTRTPAGVRRFRVTRKEGKP